MQVSRRDAKYLTPKLFERVTGITPLRRLITFAVIIRTDMEQSIHDLRTEVEVQGVRERLLAVSGVAALYAQYEGVVAMYKAAMRRFNRAALDNVLYAPLGFYLQYQAWRRIGLGGRTNKLHRLTP